MNFSKILLLTASAASTTTLINAQGTLPEQAVERPATITSYSPAEDNLGQTESHTIFAHPVNAPLADTVVDYDFSDTLRGWTVEAVTPIDTILWEWRDSLSLSAFQSALRFLPDFDSPTRENGYAFFAYLNHVTQFGAFSPGAPPYPVLNQTLASPYYDFSSATGALSLQFYSYYRALNDRSLSISFRSPDVANDVTIPYENMLTNNTSTRGLELFRVPDQFLGSDSVQIRFTYDGGFYGWAIDDILVSSLPSVSVRIDNQFFAAAPNYYTPVTQLDSLVFVTDLYNEGGEDQELTLQVLVREYDGSVFGATVAEDSLNYGVVPAGAFVENNVLLRKIPMPDEVGLYRVSYILTGPNIDDDFDPADNSFGFNFEITENRFGKSPGFSRNTRSGAGPNQDLTLGAIYYVPNNTDSVLVDSIGFGVGYEGLANNNSSPVLEVSVLGWFGDLDGDGAVTPDEFDELSLLEYDVDAATFPNDDGSYIVRPVNDQESVQLSSDYIGFIVQAKIFKATGANIDDDDIFLGIGNGPSYGGYSLANDSLGVSRYATVIATETNGYNYSFFTSAAPYNPAWISQLLISNKTPLDASAFSVSPNPASDMIRVAFDFEQNERVVFKVINATGQQIRSYVRDNVQQGMLEIPTQGLANGLYYIQATTADARQGSKPVMINR